MANPKRRISGSRRGNRRSHQALIARPVNVCPRCSEIKMPHKACPSCGYYRNRQIVSIKTEEKKK